MCVCKCKHTVRTHTDIYIVLHAYCTVVYWMLVQKTGTRLPRSQSLDALPLSITHIHTARCTYTCAQTYMYTFSTMHVTNTHTMATQTQHMQITLTHTRTHARTHTHTHTQTTHSPLATSQAAGDWQDQGQFHLPPDPLLLRLLPGPLCRGPVLPHKRLCSQQRRRRIRTGPRCGWGQREDQSPHGGWERDPCAGAPQNPGRHRRESNSAGLVRRSECQGHHLRPTERDDQLSVRRDHPRLQPPHHHDAVWVLAAGTPEAGGFGGGRCGGRRVESLEMGRA